MKHKTIRPRLMAFLLVLCMVLGLTPAYATSSEEETSNDTSTSSDKIHVSSGELVLDEPHQATLRAGCSYTYTFTLTDPATYIVYYPYDELTRNITVKIEGTDKPVSYWQGFSDCGYYAYCYNEGTYFIEIENPTDHDLDVPITVTQARSIPSSMIEIALNQTAITSYVGSTAELYAYIKPQFLTGYEVREWTVSNPDILEIVSSDGFTCEILLKKEGTATLTAMTKTDGKFPTASCTVTVKEPTILELGVLENYSAEYGSAALYTFTPEESGEYVFSLPRGDSYGGQLTIADGINGEPLEIHRSWDTYEPFGEWHSESYELVGGIPYQLSFSVLFPEWGSAIGSFIVNKLAAVTDAILWTNKSEIMVSDTVNALVITTPYNSYPGLITNVTIDNEDVLTSTLIPNFPLVMLQGTAPGEATITVQTTAGIEVQTTVTVLHTHELTLVEEFIGTCATGGMKAHYKCSICEKLYSDAEGKTEVTAADLAVSVAHTLTKTEAVAPTYDAPGSKDYYTCTICKKLFADAEGKTETSAQAVVLAQLIKVEENTAVVSPEAVDKAVEDGTAADEVIIDVSKTDNKISEVELPVESLETLKQAEKPLTIVTEHATVVLDTATLSTVTEAANGSEVTVRVVQINTQTLNKKQQEAVAEHEVLVVISADIRSNDEYIGDFKGGKATVKVPLKLAKDEDAKDYSVFFVDDEGNLEPVECFYKNGDMYFVTSHFSEYVILKNTGNNETTPSDPNGETTPSEPNDETIPSEPSEETSPSEPSEEAAPSEPSEETTSPAPSDPNVPNTGDNSALSFTTIIFLFSTVGIAYVFAVSQKITCTRK